MRAWALAGLALALGGAGAMAETGHKGYEAPPCRVEAAEGAREVRACGAHVVAEVRVAGGRGSAIGTGFNLLAGYIFGANASGEKISMTVPVTQTPEPDGKVWRIRFLMPAAAVAAGLPDPKDDRIAFRKVPAGRQVVERFPGVPETDDLAARAEALRAWAEARGLRISGGPHYQFYDSPMTWPAKRRNEVTFDIAP
ncbi:heme-binding protein [Rhodobacter sp. Har01]|uniref:SOUL family heme-binding protein n=1 Tax=Rhodobacter sp. Har01 TaxID=2883999 RepID=UPI001D064211|nr:heme-binding protein [Rhodobacter sp. Har01]MCB6179350.1 heme-binding protein [Rhodobacter sp. Har01]